MRIIHQKPIQPGDEMRVTRRQMTAFLAAKLGILTAGAGYLVYEIATDKQDNDQKQPETKTNKLTKWGLITLLATGWPWLLWKHLKQPPLPFHTEGIPNPQPPSTSQEPQHLQE